MSEFKTILVCLDPDRDVQPAFNKAVYLAQKYQAKLYLFLAVYNRGLVTHLFFDNEQMEAAKVGFQNAQKRWLDTYLKEAIDLGVECESIVRWHKPLYEAIIQEADSLNVDLIIKSTHTHPALNKLFFAPNDWQLLKQANIPVLLTKVGTAPEYQRVLAAIDPELTHDKPKALDQQIIGSAKRVSDQLSASLFIGHCFDPIAYQMWSDIGFGMGIGMGPTDFTMNEENYNEYVKQLKESKQSLFNETVAAWQLADDNLMLEEGYPETWLPEKVAQLDVDLLVLGAVYHSGLVGSTAEKILDLVECDILSISLKE